MISAHFSMMTTGKTLALAPHNAFFPVSVRFPGEECSNNSLSLFGSCPDQPGFPLARPDWPTRNLPSVDASEEQMDSDARIGRTRSRQDRYQRKDDVIWRLSGPPGRIPAGAQREALENRPG
jgi:hypothetical protein